MNNYIIKLSLPGLMLMISTAGFPQKYSTTFRPGTSAGNPVTTQIHEIEIPEFQTKVIVQNNLWLGGWSKEHVEVAVPPSTGTQTISNTEYIHIPCQSVAGSHGIYLNLPVTTAPVDLRRIRLRNNQYSGFLLKEITAMSYSTYVELTNENIAPALVLQIDKDEDNKIDFNLAFQPRDQGSKNLPYDGIQDYPEIHLYEWQSWNAREGWWAIGIGEPPPGLEGLFTLAGFIEQFPQARLLGTSEEGAIRLTVGAEETKHMDFSGYIDHFKIDFISSYYGLASIHNQVLYDFEPETVCDLENEIPFMLFFQN